MFEVMLIAKTGVAVKDIMTVRVITIDINKNIEEAAKKMAKARAGSIIVIENEKPVGIITDSDIIKQVVAKNLRPSEVKVEDIMSSPILTIGPNEDMLEAERKMRKNKIKRLPVVENGKLVGIVTASDIARTCPEMVSLLKDSMKMQERVPQIVEGEPLAGICEVCGNYSENLVFVNDQWVCEHCRE